MAEAPENPLAAILPGLSLCARSASLRSGHPGIRDRPRHANRNVLCRDRQYIGRCKIYIGQLDDGVALEEQAIRLSPARSLPLRLVFPDRPGTRLLQVARVDEAISWAQEAHITKTPTFPFVSYLACRRRMDSKAICHVPPLNLRMPATSAGNQKCLRANSIAAARAIGDLDLPQARTQALLEATYLAGLHRAGVPGD